MVYNYLFVVILFYKLKAVYYLCGTAINDQHSNGSDGTGDIKIRINTWSDQPIFVNQIQSRDRD